MDFAAQKESRYWMFSLGVSDWHVSVQPATELRSCFA